MRMRSMDLAWIGAPGSARALLREPPPSPWARWDAALAAAASAAVGQASLAPQWSCFGREVTGDVAPGPWREVAPVPWPGVSREDVERFCRPDFDAASLAAARECGWDEDLAVSEDDLSLMASVGRVPTTFPTC